MFHGFAAFVLRLVHESRFCFSVCDVIGIFVCHRVLF